MISFMIIVLALFIIGIIAAVIAGMVGIAAVITFGDIFVCALLIGLIIKCLFKKKK